MHGWLQEISRTKEEKGKGGMRTDGVIGFISSWACKPSDVWPRWDSHSPPCPQRLMDPWYLKSLHQHLLELCLVLQVTDDCLLPADNGTVHGRLLQVLDPKLSHLQLGHIEESTGTIVPESYPWHQFSAQLSHIDSPHRPILPILILSLTQSSRC